MPQFGSKQGTFDDEVEFRSMSCAFCSLDLEKLSISQRQLHYDRHINDLDKQAEGSKSTPIVIDLIDESRQQSEYRNITPDPLRKKKSNGALPCMRETDPFWYVAQATPPPPSFTPGLIQLLRKGLLKNHARGQIRRAVLCYENVVHVNREPWDASWGCGYRNFLMACTSLVNQTQQPLYFPRLDSPLSPSIRNLQIWIEAAWKEGFDDEGRRELKKLVNTKKWIGTSDLWVAFVFRGIPAELVDFDLGTKSQEKASDQIIVNWVVNYFTPNQPSPEPADAYESLKISPIITSDKMPLILQHNGHSRTVVGYETDKNGITNLLVFDPSYCPPLEVRAAALAGFSRSSDAVSDQSPMLKRKWSETQNDQASGAGESSRGNRRPTPKPFSPIRNGLFKAKSSVTGDNGLDLITMIKKFRLEPKRLQKKKQYQILYFPMSAPLTDHERMQLKEVRSTKIS
ncbi:hypothetical protein CVT25_011795 [Psilocybe cyanescens]|uniref:UFSP1/2/DUB catalytic domain-containing protein n=1 Tax=Psilocybe cyanescens TaxID=93625 RepID=A0A409WJ27_PSICY|nr:hypothetical protein CVT25_011795 [Psilocybe cyanescens]